MGTPDALKSPGRIKGLHLIAKAHGAGGEKGSRRRGATVHVLCCHDDVKGFMTHHLNPPHHLSPGTRSPTGLRLHHEHHRGAGRDVDIVGLSGELDLHGVIELRRQLPARLAHLLPGEGSVAVSTIPANPLRGTAADVNVVDAGACRDHLLLADLAGVTFLDSAGIGALISLHRRLADVGGHFAVCCLQDQPRRVLAMTAIDKVLSVHPTLAGALSPSPSSTPAA